MSSAAGTSDADPRIVRLSADWEPAGQSLTPEEGFLLSRIDGRTAWADLRKIGGLPSAEVDRYLERWLEQGIVELEGAAVAAPPETVSEPVCERDQRIDSTLDIDTELQRRILEFEASLDRPYFDILGLEADADGKDIKRAYFALSKVYHPDRYFRLQLGDFKERLDRIFRKLVEAYELLSDPMTRAEIERGMPRMRSAPPPPSEEDVAAGESDASSGVERHLPPRKLNRRQTLERLRRHFRLPEKIMTERRAKAVELFRSATVAAKRGRWSDAAPSLRLAIAFDPWNEEYRARFADFQAMYHEQRARDLLEQSEDGIDSSAQAEALRLLEEVLIHRPADAAVNFRAASLAFDLGEFERATEYAESACDLSPDCAAHHLLLGRISRKAGVREKALRSLRTAAELDPDNPEIQKELKETRRATRRNR
jgi:curved DNA-binding protein CbpA